MWIVVLQTDVKSGQIWWSWRGGPLSHEWFVKTITEDKVDASNAPRRPRKQWMSQVILDLRGNTYVELNRLAVGKAKNINQESQIKPIDN